MAPKTPVFLVQKAKWQARPPAPFYVLIFVLPFLYFESKKIMTFEFVIFGEHIDIERIQLEGKIVSSEFKDDIFSQSNLL